MPKSSSRNSQLIIPVAELLRRPGSHRALAFQVDFDGLANSDAVVRGPVDLQLNLESVIGGLEVTGSATTGWQGSCRRCLEPIEQTVQQDMREMFSSAPADEETYLIQEGDVDLTPMVRDCLVLALPIAPLCSENCAGPAPEAYPMNQTETTTKAHTRDPRWAALDALRTGR